MAITAAQLKARFEFYTNDPDQPRQLPGFRGAIVGVLERACRGTAHRRMVLRYLAGKTSSKELTDSQWHALERFTKPVRVGGQWQSGHGMELERMCGLILAAIAEADKAQLRMPGMDAEQPQDLADHG